MKPTVNIFWFRRDLRLDDNTALFHALKAGIPVVPIFIFDMDILNQLEDKKDSRVEFIHKQLEEIQLELVSKDSTMIVEHGRPAAVFNKLLNEFDIKSVFTNHDYEPYALERDDEVRKLLQPLDISIFAFKDHVIFEKDEVVKDNNLPYTVFTPYSKKWKGRFLDTDISPFHSEKYLGSFFKQSPREIMSLEKIGFQPAGIPFPSKDIFDKDIKDYNKTRDFPALKGGTTHLGVHLRFGTISIRKLMKYAMEKNETYVNELIWREFYQTILWHFPKVGKGSAFKADYENIQWRNNEDEFDKWCVGETGYPIVDAGMRELNATGYMHNRVRMIVASFLCKHLLIDWRWGEAYFASKLLDYELASNNGGWQWAAGSGCDAAPYFRIFNPYLQTDKFDKKHTYIKKWVPEYQEFNYPKPLVEHTFARKRALEVYGKALKK